MLRSPGYGSIDAIILGSDSADTQVLFNSSNTIAGSSKLVFDSATGKLTNAQGTLTTSQPFALSQTWNAGGVTFLGWSFDITDTASAGASVAFRIRGGAAGTTSLLSLSSVGTLLVAQLQTTGNLALTSNGSTFVIGSSFDTILARDAANVLALRNTTNVQTFNWYGNYVSSTDYHRGALSVAKTTLSAVSGASVTATNLIPDGAFLIGVTTKVTVAISGGGGTTGYQIGDGSDADRWGEATTITAGTSTDNTNATANPTGAFTAAQSVVITAVGGNFNGTGDIMVSAIYLIAQCD